MVSHSKNREYFVGMMSGTSLDGIDAVIGYRQGSLWKVVSHIQVAIPCSLKKTLYALNFSGHMDEEIHCSKVAEHLLTKEYARAYKKLLNSSNIDPSAIAAIGAHGQTIRHQPNDRQPYTLQLLDGALLSALCQKTVVCDFRSKDIACGGQGAPLAPIFHQSIFSLQSHMAIVNIGGIANISQYHNDGYIYGYDCGPGNCLMDEWIEKQLGKPYDFNGDWASTGSVITGLLAHLKKDTFCTISPPKSTGRDYFNGEWLSGYLKNGEKPVDVMRTLTQYTAELIAEGLSDSVNELIVTGGGAKNALLLSVIKKAAPSISVKTSSDVGVNEQHVEALGFAVLAKHSLSKQRVSITNSANKSRFVILGAIHFH